MNTRNFLLLGWLLCYATSISGQAYLADEVFETNEFETCEGALVLSNNTKVAFGHYLVNNDPSNSNASAFYYQPPQNTSSFGYFLSPGSEDDKIMDGFQVGGNIYYCGYTKNLPGSLRRPLVLRASLGGISQGSNVVGISTNLTDYGDINYQSAAVTHNEQLVICGNGFVEGQQRGFIQRVDISGIISSAGLFDEIFAGSQRLTSISKVLLLQDQSGYIVIGEVDDNLEHCGSFGDFVFPRTSVGIVRTDLNFNELPGSNNFTVIGGNTDDKVINAILTDAGNLVILGESNCIEEGEFNGPGGVVDINNSKWIWSSSPENISTNNVVTTTNYPPFTSALYFKSAVDIVQGCDSGSDILVISHRTAGVQYFNNWYTVDSYNINGSTFNSLTNSLVTGEEGEAIPSKAVIDPTTGNLIIGMTHQVYANFELVNTHAGLSFFDPGPLNCEDCSDAIEIECGETIFDNNELYANNYLLADYTGCFTNCNGCQNPFSGPDVLYRFNKEDNNSDLVITLDPVSADLDIFLFPACPGEEFTFQQTDCTNSSTGSGTVTEVITIPNAAAGEYYLVVDGYNNNQISEYSLTVDCCASTFYYSDTNEDCGQFYSFGGDNEFDLTYFFTVAEDEDLTFNEPWLVDGLDVFPGFNNNFISYEFPGPGIYEVCYPLFFEDAHFTGEDQQINCDLDYCCATYCIDYQPANLEGRLTCENCTCTENDPFLPQAFLCDNFNQYPADDAFFSFDTNQWVGSGFYDIVEENELNNFLRVVPLFDEVVNGINLKVRTGKNNNVADGRYRVSFDLRTNDLAAFDLIDQVGEFDNSTLYGLQFEDGSIQVTEGFSSVATFFANYPPNEWFEFSQVISLESGIANVQLFINRNFIGEFSVLMDDFGYLGFPNFYGVGNHYDIDNICLRTQPLFELPCTTNAGEDVCLPFGDSYDNACAAGQAGLYAQGEYGNCFSVCNFGGTLITRSDGAAPYAGELTATNLAPNLLYQDPCLVDLYVNNVDIPVPDTLYADIYTFQNDERTDLIVSGLPNGFYPLLYQCICDESSCSQVCVEPQAGTFDSYTIEPNGYYYLVIVGAQTGSYGYEIFPSGDCEVDPADILICGDPASDEVTMTTFEVAFTEQNNYSVAQHYGSCYNGFRTYEGNDKVYRLDVTEPSFLSFDLDVEGGTAAMFIFSNVCGEDCYAYLDNRIFEDTASIDSLRFGTGTYYLIFDQELPVSSLTATITCAPDLFNDNGGSFDVLNIIYDNTGCSGTIEPFGEPHQLSLQLASPIFEPGTELILEYIRDGEDGETTRGGLNVPATQATTDGSDLQPYTFNLPLNLEADCGFQVNDSLVIVGRNGNTYTTYSFTDFINQVPFVNSDLFIPGGISRAAGVRADSAVSLDVLNDQLIFDNNGVLNGDFNIQGAFTIADFPDWLNFGLLEYPIPINNAIGVSADPNNTNVPRLGEITIQSLFTPPVIQTVSVIQYAACGPANLSVSPENITVCLGDTIPLQLTNNNSTNLDQYDVYLNGTLIEGPDYVISPDVSGLYIITISDRSPGCVVESQATINVQVVPPVSQLEFIQPSLANCSSNLENYFVDFTTSESIVSSNASSIQTAPGVNNYRAVGILAGTSFELTLSNGSCERIFVVPPPDCSCPANAPTPVPNYTSTAYCAGNTPLPLMVADLTGYTAVWSDEQGTELVTGPDFSPQGAGAYFVSYRNDDFPGCSGSSIEIIVDVLTDIEAMLEAPLSVCQGEQVTVTISDLITSDLLPISYVWNDNRTDLPSYNFTADEAGMVSVELRLEYNQNGTYICSNLFSTQVEVTATPTISASFIEPCYADTNFYRVQVVSSADSIAHNLGDLLITDSSFIFNNIPIEDTLHVTAFNFSSNGLACPSSTFITVPPEDCSCPSNEVNYQIPVSIIDFCPGSELTPINLPDSIGFTPLVTLASTGTIIPLIGESNAFLPPDTGLYYIQLLSDSFECIGFNLYELSVRYSTEIAAAIEDVEAKCFGVPIMLNGSDSNGSELTYSWSGPGNFTNPAGAITNVEEVPIGIQTFTLAILDENGCTDTTSTTVEVLDPPQAESSVVQELACFGDSTGIVFANALGGTPPYLYVWNQTDTTQLLNALAAGIYELEVIDSQGCSDTVNVTLTQPSAIIVDSINMTPTVDGGSNGGLTAFINGGVQPYEYLWYFASQNTDPLSGSNNLEGQLAGNSYILVVEDANGCELVVENLVIENVSNIVEQPLERTQVYPNPTNDQLTIDWSDAQQSPLAIELRTMEGRLVSYYPLDQLNGDFKNLSIANLPASIYLLRIRFSSGSYEKRVVKW